MSRYRAIWQGAGVKKTVMKGREGKRLSRQEMRLWKRSYREEADRQAALRMWEGGFENQRDLRMEQTQRVVKREGVQCSYLGSELGSQGRVLASLFGRVPQRTAKKLRQQHQRAETVSKGT